MEFGEEMIYQALISLTQCLFWATVLAGTREAANSLLAWPQQQAGPLRKLSQAHEAESYHPYFFFSLSISPGNVFLVIGLSI